MGKGEEGERKLSSSPLLGVFHAQSSLKFIYTFPHCPEGPLAQCTLLSITPFFFLVLGCPRLMTCGGQLGVLGLHCPCPWRSTGSGPPVPTPPRVSCALTGLPWPSLFVLIPDGFSPVPCKSWLLGQLLLFVVGANTVVPTCPTTGLGIQGAGAARGTPLPPESAEGRAVLRLLT